MSKSEKAKITGYLPPDAPPWGAMISLGLQQVLTNVVGFDLNPLAVISARANYLLALGDLSWRDYTVTVPITVFGIDESGYAGASNGPGVGVMVRWQGHYDAGNGVTPRTGWRRRKPTSGRLPSLGSALVQLARERLDGAGEFALRSVTEVQSAPFLEPGAGASFVDSEPFGEGDDALAHVVQLRRARECARTALVEVAPELLAKLPERTLDPVGRGGLRRIGMRFQRPLRDEATADVPLGRTP